MINEQFPPGHFYSVIPNITKDYNNNNTKFLNLDFHEESHKSILNEINNYLVKFDKEFGHTNILERQNNLLAAQTVLASALSGAFEQMFTTMIDGGQNAFQSILNAIKSYVNSLDTLDNIIYKDNELLILSCFSKSIEIVEKLTPIELPSDEEIENKGKWIFNNDGHTISTHYNTVPSWVNGAKWMKQQIHNQNK